MYNKILGSISNVFVQPIAKYLKENSQGKRTRKQRRIRKTIEGFSAAKNKGSQRIRR